MTDTSPWDKFFPVVERIVNLHRVAAHLDMVAEEFLSLTVEDQQDHHNNRVQFICDAINTAGRHGQLPHIDQLNCEDFLESCGMNHCWAFPKPFYDDVDECSRGRFEHQQAWRYTWLKFAASFARHLAYEEKKHGNQSNH